MDQFYQIQLKRGQGAYSEVYTAFSKKINKQVAIKCFKAQYDSIQKIKKQKQIKALMQLSHHPNIVKLLDVLYDQKTRKLALVFQLMDMNLYQFIKSNKKEIPQTKIKELAYHLLQTLHYIHSKNIFHRDIKPQNILISGNKIKLADFGSCKNSLSDQPYTQYIATRWYRAPQCLLTNGFYGQKMDLWSLGCVIFQLFSRSPLFPGKNQLDQIDQIHTVLGLPQNQVFQKFKKNGTYMELNFPKRSGIGLRNLIPEASQNLLDLLEKLLTYDPDQRINCQQALRHKYFEQIRISQNQYPHQKKKKLESEKFLPPINVPLYLSNDKYNNKLIKKKKQIMPGLNLSDIVAAKKYLI